MHTFNRSSATILTVSIVLALLLVLNYSSAQWQPAPTSPPSDNVDAPINVGPQSQMKLGDDDKKEGRIGANQFIAFSMMRSDWYCDQAGEDCIQHADLYNLIDEPSKPTPPPPMYSPPPSSVGGCTDLEARNYDGTATYDDGSCKYTPLSILNCDPPTNTYERQIVAGWYEQIERCPASAGFNYWVGQLENNPSFTFDPVFIGGFQCSVDPLTNLQQCLDENLCAGGYTYVMNTDYCVKN